MIYKIVSQAQWFIAEQDGQFGGSQVDLSDGYIHFSTADQVKQTAAKHFAGQSDLLLVAVDPAKLNDLRWEPSRGGDLFPHLYDNLSLEAVISTVALPLDETGQHVFPKNLGRV